jgi:hypothetical protein
MFDALGSKVSGRFPPWCKFEGEKLDEKGAQEQRDKEKDETQGSGCVPSSGAEEN